jgi:hypothetical protein
MSKTTNSFQGNCHTLSRADRARLVAANGWIERDYDGFSVAPEGAEGATFRVLQIDGGRFQCTCPEFEAQSEKDRRFHCEHILAVKFHLEGESATDCFDTGPRSGGQFVPFLETLKELSAPLPAEVIKQKAEGTDGNYIEWHTACNLLDRICPEWSHQVKCIKQIGDYVAVVVSITIQGVTRQGIGTGLAYDETGIKKAEHDALKRAAVKFGLARELYRKDEQAAPSQISFPHDPVAKCMADLVTPKQLVAIRAIANSQRVNAQSECMKVFNCKPEELSRRAASAFIEYLKGISRNTVEACRSRKPGKGSQEGENAGAYVEKRGL